MACLVALFPVYLQVAVFPVLGNHDYYTDPYAQIARYLRNATLPDVITGVAPASPFEGPVSTFAGVDVVKLAQAHALFPWISLKKGNKGMRFLKNGIFSCSTYFVRTLVLVCMSIHSLGFTLVIIWLTTERRR